MGGRFDQTGDLAILPAEAAPALPRAAGSGYPGGVVVAPDAAYNGVVATLGQREADGAISVRRIDVTDTQAVVAALDALGLGPATRPEQVSPERFVALFDQLGGEPPA